MNKCWINEIIVPIKMFPVKNLLPQPNFETGSKLLIKLYIMGHPFKCTKILIN